MCIYNFFKYRYVEIVLHVCGLHFWMLCRPAMGYTRMITAELQSRPFGIDIETSQMSGGIFVSMVEPGSVAAQNGVMIGDQLLEVSVVFLSCDCFCAFQQDPVISS